MGISNKIYEKVVNLKNKGEKLGHLIKITLNFIDTKNSH